MELKLTTKRALEYETRTGKDVLLFLQDVAKTGEIKIKDVVDLFIAMGDGYTVDAFDNWNASYSDKITAIMNAVKEYAEGKK